MEAGTEVQRGPECNGQSVAAQQRTGGSGGRQAVSVPAIRAAQSVSRAGLKLGRKPEPRCQAW
jgi:hypothetical protein